MTLQQRIQAFDLLGKFLRQFGNSGGQRENIEELAEINAKFYDKADILIQELKYYNPWFVERFVRSALQAAGAMLHRKKLEKWLQYYPEMDKNAKGSRVGVIMAGNIPLVGFHDMLCVLITGNVLIGKLSSKDEHLPEMIRELLIAINPAFADYIIFEKEILKQFDAIIATGSDNSSRYFEYYFGKYPRIIRKNRNAAAVLTGDESPEALTALTDDIFLYFGLGCRNVSKIYLPAGYDVKTLFKYFEKYTLIKDHYRYFNNYEYNKAIYLVNRTPHLDNGFVLLKEDTGISSPVGVLFYEYYKNIDEIRKTMTGLQDRLQCVVSQDRMIPASIPFGSTQYPEVWDYADNVDTIKFLSL